MPRRIRAIVALSLMAVGALLASPGTALADCMPPPPIEVAVETAEIVFVGTVTETAQGNRWASVAVEEIWRGPDLEASVVVKGGPAGNMATSVDRYFEAGVRYLFFPYADQEQGGLADNSCSSTQPWTEDMAKLRPADARTPVEGPGEPSAGGFDVAGLAGPVALVAVVFVVLLAIGLVARGRSEA
jgi:hypothetical protein